MASPEQPKARPDSPRGIRELFDSVRGVVVESQGRRYSCRPQRGTGVQCARANKHAEDVTQLTRMADRGDPPPLHLLRRCLQRICDLEISSSGGDALLWMVSPVLEAARRQLMQDSQERRMVEAEANTFRQRLEMCAMEVEDQRSKHLREQERIRVRVRQQQETTKAMVMKALTLLEERRELEAACRQLELQIGRKTEDGPFGAEKRQLKAEVDQLQANLNELNEMKNSLAEPTEAAEERVAKLRHLIEETQPLLAKKEQLRREQARVAEENEDLEKEIEELQQQRAKKEKRPSVKPRQSVALPNPKRKVSQRPASLLPPVKPSA
ncbi:unnamed protein product [Symbiodinium sp. CCMP2456]|nr:unnamed protein product [Symbiodinium sp. CCMP2456]